MITSFAFLLPTPPETAHLLHFQIGNNMDCSHSRKATASKTLSIYVTWIYWILLSQFSLQDGCKTYLAVTSQL